MTKKNEVGVGVRMMKTAARLFRDRAPLPEQKIGKYAVEHRVHKAGSCLPVSTAREAVLTGIPEVRLTLAKDEIIHNLVGPEGTWMSDLPCEMIQMHQQLATPARGRVLVGGLGLGIVARMLAKKRSVERVTVVEIQQEVIDMVKPYLPKNASVVKADVHEYVKAIDPGQFGSALIDHYQGTGEIVWLNEVVPLRRALTKKKIPRIRFWHEAIMINQVAMMLFRCIDYDPEVFQSRWQGHYRTFIEGMRKIGMAPKAPRVIIAKGEQRDLTKALEYEIENRNNIVLRAFISRYLTEVGSPYWERSYGEFWNRYVGERKRDEEEEES